MTVPVVRNYDTPQESSTKSVNARMICRVDSTGSTEYGYRIRNKIAPKGIVRATTDNSSLPTVTGGGSALEER